MKFSCPTYAIDCPYYDKKTGACTMTDEGLDPIMECDDAAAAYFEEDDDSDIYYSDYNDDLLAEE